MKALVSILIPAYNAEEWVVDHGPTDGTLAVARQFESNEVRVATQPNQGAVAARVPSAGDTANPDELLRGCGAWGRRFAAKNHSANSSRCSYFFHVIFHLNIHSFGPYFRG